MPLSFAVLQFFLINHLVQGYTKFTYLPQIEAKWKCINCFTLLTFTTGYYQLKSIIIITMTTQSSIELNVSKYQHNKRMRQVVILYC